MKYCDTSYENMWWIDRQLKNDQGMIYDNVDGKSCHVTNWQFTCELVQPLISKALCIIH